MVIASWSKSSVFLISGPLVYKLCSLDPKFKYPFKSLYDISVTLSSQDINQEKSVFSKCYQPSSKTDNMEKGKTWQWNPLRLMYESCNMCTMV